MMSIQDMLNQFEIQGDYCIKFWSEEIGEIVLFKGCDLMECDLDDETLNAEILYLYAENGMLNIEIKYDEDEEEF